VALQQFGRFWTRAEVSRWKTDREMIVVRAVMIDWTLKVPNKSNLGLVEPTIKKRAAAKGGKVVMR
jgi:hypothetical protein